MEEKVFFEGEFGKICGILNTVNKDNEMVIILHGLSANKSGGASIYAKELENININSLRIDLDNQGESDLDFISQVGIPNYIKQVKSSIEFLKKQGFKEISLIGTSFGGLVALSTALTEKNIKRIFLRAPVLDEQKAIKSEFGEKRLEEYKEKGFIPYINGKGQNLNHSFNRYTTAKDYSMYDRAKEINQPIKIIQGDKDKEVDYKVALEVIKLFPNAELNIIKGATHNLSVNGDFTIGLEKLKEFFSKKLN